MTNVIYTNTDIDSDKINIYEFGNINAYDTFAYGPNIYIKVPRSECKTGVEFNAICLNNGERILLEYCDRCILIDIDIDIKPRIRK